MKIILSGLGFTLLWGISVSMPLFADEKSVSLSPVETSSTGEQRESQVFNANTAVAAEYRTTVILRPHYGPEEMEQTTWRYWRDANSVEIESRTSGEGERFVWDGHKISAQRLYHARQFKVIYEASDLNTHRASDLWQEKSRLVSPALIARLTLDQTRYDDERVIEFYNGSVAAAQFSVQWDRSNEIPVYYQEETQQRTLIIELLSLAGKLSAARRDSRDYDDIDYADLGDNESHADAKQHILGRFDNSIQYPH